MNRQSEDLAVGKARMLTLILSGSSSHKCIHQAKERGILSCNAVIGRGTVKNSVLNALGIKSQKREILQFLLNKDQAAEMLDLFDEELHLKQPGHGIAFMTSVLHATRLEDRKTETEKAAAAEAQGTEGVSMFQKLTVVVDRGMADDVMDIARKAGVRGGTILHGRGSAVEASGKLFGIEIEPEKELVIILTPKSIIDRVIRALSDELELDKPGKGMLFVEPILETRGLVEMNETADR